MNRFLPRLLVPAVIACGVFGLGAFSSGCLQGDNDRCQLDTDCSSGHCSIPAGGSAQQGGTCASVSTSSGVDMAAPTPEMPMAVPPDLTMPMPDMPSDMAMPMPDLARLDSANPDSAKD